ncbi:unnamed protein product [Mytilus coruscus]|uniref:CCHC-type domain-containing protein n=1 Tax=Mytilus coruscus TaxID=42192 RepID=A0A6J8DYE5_MYTCO|nr:unnamed protein product [Mytilus coruscus]
MNAEVEALCRKMTQDRLKRFIEGLQGTDTFTLQNEVTVSPDVNNDKMATYADAVSDIHKNQSNIQSDQSYTENSTHYKALREQSDPSDFVKPIFLKDQDVHGSVKPPRAQWLTNVEIFKSIGAKVLKECIKGIQRIREMWRIYMDNEEEGICHKCLQPGHMLFQCPNDWACKICKESGHKMIECQKHFQDKDENTQQLEQNGNESGDDNVQEESVELTKTPTKSPPSKTSENRKGGSKKHANKSGQQKTNLGNSDSIDKTQPSMERFVRTPHRRTVNAGDRTPPTPTEALHEKTTGVNGTKKTKA